MAAAKQTSSKGPGPLGRAFTALGKWVASIPTKLAALVARALVGVAYFMKKFGLRGLVWSFRRGPFLLLVAAVVYALLVLRATATLENFLWLGNSIFAIALAAVGLQGLATALDRPRLRAFAGRLGDEKKEIGPTDVRVLDPDGTERKRIPLGRAMYVIGRGPECDIRLGGGTISRRHCCIVRRGGRYRVEDVGSTYGTLLNGRKLPDEGALLRRGDVIAFAATGDDSPRLLVGPAGDTPSDAP